MAGGPADRPLCGSGHDSDHRPQSARREMVRPVRERARPQRPDARADDRRPLFDRRREAHLQRPFQAAAPSPGRRRARVEQGQLPLSRISPRDGQAEICRNRPVLDTRRKRRRPGETLVSGSRAGKRGWRGTRGLPARLRTAGRVRALAERPLRPRPGPSGARLDGGVAHPGDQPRHPRRHARRAVRHPRAHGCAGAAPGVAALAAHRLPRLRHRLAGMGGGGPS